MVCHLAGVSLLVEEDCDIVFPPIRRYPAFPHQFEKLVEGVMEGGWEGFQYLIGDAVGPRGLTPRQARHAVLVDVLRV